MSGSGNSLSSIKVRRFISIFREIDKIGTSEGIFSKGFCRCLAVDSNKKNGADIKISKIFPNGVLSLQGI